VVSPRGEENHRYPGMEGFKGGEAKVGHEEIEFRQAFP
jgi:hypothetical protein